MSEVDYNGYKNRETWNVALCLSNSEPLYRMVMAYGKEMSYRDLATNYLVYVSAGTGDGVAWLDDNLDYDALDELIEELG
jgi:hypothetical protein